MSTSPAQSPASEAQRQHLLVVHHSAGGTTAALCQAAVEAARQAAGTVETRSLRAVVAGHQDVWWAHGVLIATPANFGYMSGAMKDFFERIYHRCLGRTSGLSYALLVKGDTDVDGAVASVERIATGLQWRRVLPPVNVVGDATPTDFEQAGELGATLAAGLEAGIF